MGNHPPNKEACFAELTRGFVSEDTIVSLIFFDLDGFKAVNDELGHQEGDRCLENIAKLASDVIRSKGTLYRYGGDEFAIVVPNFDASEAQATADRIRKEIIELSRGEKVGVTA